MTSALRSGDIPEHWRRSEDLPSGRSSPRMRAVASGVTQPVDRLRPSAADRERAAELLRRACLDQRLSAETFSGRLDLVYAARTRAELDRLLGDVPEPRLLRRLVLAGVSWLSSWSNDVRAAWRQPRTPRLVLPNR